MILRHHFTAVLGFTFTISIAPALLAQDSEPTINWGGFQNTGSATVGYRLDSISGRKEMFQQLFNLNSGFRLFDFDITGRAKQDSNLFADTYSFTASGLGGDPFPSGQFTISKANVYDFRANFRQSYYYWDQNDQAILPSGLNGLTGNHNWATVRKFGSMNLLIHVSHNFRLRFEYNRNSHDGTDFSTRALDYYGAPSSWGTFIRDNPYYVVGPIDETMNKVAGGFDYTISNWNVHYTVGYQTFQQNMSWANPTIERSINIDSTANVLERLLAGNWWEHRLLHSPSSELFFNGKINPRFNWRGDFLYFRYSGPSSIYATYDGTERTNTTGTKVAPYAITYGSQANVVEPNYVLDQGFTVKIAEWLNFDTDYRFNHFTEDGGAGFQSTDSTGLHVGTSDQQWRESLQQLDTRLEFTPLAGLTISPGVRLMKRDVVAIVDGQVDSGRTLRTKTVWPIASFFYQPNHMLTIRGDYQNTTNGTSYTRITPHTDVGTRWFVKFHPTKRLSVEDNFAIRTRKLIDSSFDSKIRSNAATVSYAITDRYSGFAGFSYDSFVATASVTFLRGTAPLNTTWRDQTVNRVWQLGIRAQPTRRLGFNFAGNFVRTTGLGEITGELPNYGPMSFPMATATAHYDAPKLGRLALDLQRAYYIEKIVTGNNFSANLLTVRWGTNF
jgi:hypothetical protein